MRRMILLFALTTLTSTALFAQQPVGNTVITPTTGAPGTATPQPYAPAMPQHLPSVPVNRAPLLKPAPLPERSQTRTDQDVQLLREQRERNVQPLKQPSE
jgi:uncharacterized iron-regulated membrane protein